MTEQKLTFRDLARKSHVAIDTAYRLVERTPDLVRDPLIKVGKTLGFTERSIREKARQERLSERKTFSRKEQFYQIVSDLVNFFEADHERRR
jgi:plasmid maintenance system antidote protein VapI